MTTPNHPPLSPAAQAVWDAAVRAEPGQTISAALRAAVAATQMRQYGDCWICDADKLLAIANELEAQP